MIQPAAPAAIASLPVLAGPGPAQAETPGFSAEFEALLANGLAASGETPAPAKALAMPASGKPGGRILPVPVGEMPETIAQSAADGPDAPGDDNPEDTEAPQPIAVALPLAIADQLEFAVPKPASARPDRATPAQQAMPAPVGRKLVADTPTTVARPLIQPQKNKTLSSLEVSGIPVQLTPLVSNRAVAGTPEADAAAVPIMHPVTTAISRPADFQLTIFTESSVPKIAGPATSQFETPADRKPDKAAHAAALPAPVPPDRPIAMDGEMPVAASQLTALPLQASAGAFLPAAAPRQALAAATEVSDTRPRPRTASALADHSATSDAVTQREPAMPPLLAMREAATFGPPAAAPAAAPVLPDRDFAALVDRLVEAREAGLPVQGPLAVAAALSHGEFGKVTLRFEQDGGSLSVAMASADPDFLPAVQAAAANAQTTSTADNGATAQRQDSTGQQSSANPGHSEAQGRSQPRGTARDAPSANPSRSAPQPRGDESGGRRGSIYA